MENTPVQQEKDSSLTVTTTKKPPAHLKKKLSRCIAKERWSKAKLIDFYQQQGLSIENIAKLASVSPSTIRCWLVSYNIPRRNLINLASKNEPMLTASGKEIPTFTLKEASAFYKKFTRRRIALQDLKAHLEFFGLAVSRYVRMPTGQYEEQLVINVRRYKYFLQARAATRGMECIFSSEEL